MASMGIQPAGWTWAAALAAACLLIVTLWLSDQERRRANELAQARGELMHVVADRDRVLQALSFLNQPETKQVGFGKGPRGNVFLNSTRGVLLISSNLPRLDAGKIFEMWVIPKGGAPRPAGLFEANPDGTAVHVPGRRRGSRISERGCRHSRARSRLPGAHVNPHYRSRRQLLNPLNKTTYQP